MDSSSLSLRDYPTKTVRLSCRKCGRSSQNRKQKLMELYGADIRLPDLREQMAQCTQREMYDVCMCYFVDLVTAGRLV